VDFVLAACGRVGFHYRCNIAKKDSEYHAVGSRLMRSDVYFRFNSLLWSTLGDFFKIIAALFLEGGVIFRCI